MRTCVSLFISLSDWSRQDASCRETRLDITWRLFFTRWWTSRRSTSFSASEALRSSSCLLAAVMSRATRMTRSASSGTSGLEAPGSRRDDRLVFHDDETPLLEGRFDARLDPFGEAWPQVHLGDEPAEEFIGRDDELIHGSGAVFEISAIPIESEEKTGRAAMKARFGLARLELLQPFLDLLRGRRDAPLEHEDEEGEDEAEAEEDCRHDDPYPWIDGGGNLRPDHFRSIAA